jgi:hypothetical protein
MNQGTQGYSLAKKTDGKKSRETVSLIKAILVPFKMANIRGHQ